MARGQELFDKVAQLFVNPRSATERAAFPSASSRRRDSKQSHTTRTKRRAIANIQQSCFDSLAIANPMDGFFGTDSIIADSGVEIQ